MAPALLTKLRTLVSGKTAAEHPEKHIRYFKLIDAMDPCECPVCRLLEKAEEQFIHTLLLERVTDRALRARFDKNGGFCRHHTRMLLKRHDGLGMVILNRLLLEREIQRLEGHPPADNPLPGGGACEICTYLAEHEERYITSFKSYLNEEKMIAALKEGVGFCIPHTRMLEAAAPAGLPDWFRRFQAKAYRELQDRCDRYRESENCTHQERPRNLTREEQLIWKDMVAQIYGVLRR